MPGQMASPATWPPARRHRTHPLFPVSPPADRKASAPSDYVPETISNRFARIAVVNYTYHAEFVKRLWLVSSVASRLPPCSASELRAEVARSGQASRGPMPPVGGRPPSAPECLGLLEIPPQPPRESAQPLVKRLRAYHPPAARAAAAAASPARAMQLRPCESETAGSSAMPPTGGIAQ